MFIIGIDPHKGSHTAAVIDLLDWLQRRRSSVPQRGTLRALQRDRADRSIQRTARSSSPQPERQPPTEPRNPPCCGHADRARHTRPRLLPPQASRREVAQRSDALPQTTHQRRGLPTTPRRPRPLTKTGSGRTIRGDSESSAAGRSLNTGTSERSLPNPTPTLRPSNPARHGSTLRAQTPSRTSPLTQTGFALACYCHDTRVSSPVTQPQSAAMRSQPSGGGARRQNCSGAGAASLARIAQSSSSARSCVG